MYPHFIEVHSNKDPQMELMLNVDHINYFYVNEDGVTKIMLSGLRYEEISESYDELKELITNSGALIQKGDPRLDTSHPLMMKDIEEMKSSEPVWNSDRNEWYLLRTMTEDGEVWFSDFVGSKVIATEEMLIKTPLYRMKRDNDRLYIPDGYTQAKTGDKNHE